MKAIRFQKHKDRIERLLRSAIDYGDTEGLSFFLRRWSILFTGQNDRRRQVFRILNSPSDKRLEMLETFFQHAPLSPPGQTRSPKALRLRALMVHAIELDAMDCALFLHKMGFHIPERAPDLGANPQALRLSEFYGKAVTASILRSSWPELESLDPNLEGLLSAVHAHDAPPREGILKNIWLASLIIESMERSLLGQEGLPEHMACLSRVIEMAEKREGAGMVMFAGIWASLDTLDYVRRGPSGLDGLRSWLRYMMGHPLVREMKGYPINLHEFLSPELLSVVVEVSSEIQCRELDRDTSPSPPPSSAPASRPRRL